MKILLINDQVGDFGGAETYIHSLMDLLRTHGHQVKLLGSRERVNSPSSYLSRWFSIKYWRETRKEIQIFDPEVVHLHGVSRSISPSPALAAKGLGKPVVATAHDFHIVCPRTWMIYADGAPCRYGFGYRCLIANCYGDKMGVAHLPYNWLKWAKVALHRALLRRAVDVLVCPSQVLAGWAERSLGVARVAWVPNFVDGDRFAFSPVENDAHLVYIGRLSKEKGVGNLIQAMPLVVRRWPQLRLRIVGDGPQKKALEALVDQLGLSSHIEFLGNIPNERLAEVYRWCTAVVMPSIWMENHPIVALEAFACGRPVLASDRGGLRELVVEGQSGYVFDPFDAPSIGEAVARIVGDIAAAARLGRQARALYEAEFSPEVHYGRLLSVYSSGIPQSKAAPSALGMHVRT